MIEQTEWFWGEAFSKFGFEDGDGLNMTDRVSHVIENLGYETECDTWGMHNYMIMDIRKNGESIYPKIDIAIGYTNPASYLPPDIIAELDEHFGPDESLWGA
tara:strand:+ start:157 stop:462 length:306 start_codon:yes stop_codon:yes gene_type:complete